MKHLLALLIFAYSAIALCEPNGWVTRDGKPVQNSEAMKSVDGFGGWLVVTPDVDWESKWNTSPETIPHFREASEVGYGEKLAILTFFGNPKADESGTIHITCAIKVTRPDGSVSADQGGIACASGKLQGDPKNVRLSAAVVNFVGEPGDPPGDWTIEVRLTDENKKIGLPLKAHFTLKKATANKSMKPTPESVGAPSGVGGGAAYR